MARPSTGQPGSSAPLLSGSRSAPARKIAPLVALAALGLVAVCALAEHIHVLGRPRVSLAAVRAAGVDVSEDSLRDSTVDVQGLASTTQSKAKPGTYRGTLSVGGYVNADVALLRLQNQMLQEGFPGAYKKAVRENLKGKTAAVLKGMKKSRLGLSTTVLKEKKEEKKEEKGGACGCCGKSKCGCCGGSLADASIHNTGYYLAGNHLSGNSNVIIYGTKSEVSHSGGGVANGGGSGVGKGGNGGSSSKAKKKGSKKKK